MATFESLKDSEQPRLWSHGDLFAVIDRPGPDFFVLLIGQGGSVVDRFRRSVEIGTMIKRQWSQSNGKHP